MTTNIEPTLTGKTVHELFLKLLFQEGEDAANHIPVEGVMVKVGFHPERLEQHKDEIKTLIDKLPNEFKQSGGGGWTFLNICTDKHGNQWTGSHAVQDELIMMGIAIGYVEFCMSRDMWKILPGGVPYIMVKDVANGVDTVASLSPAAKNVVDNLRRTHGDKLSPYADWQIDYAHRNWSSSDDFPDEDKIVDWIMPDTETMRYDYMRLTEKERNHHGG